MSRPTLACAVAPESDALPETEPAGGRSSAPLAISTTLRCASAPIDHASTARDLLAVMRTDLDFVRSAVRADRSSAVAVADALADLRLGIARLEMLLRRAERGRDDEEPSGVTLRAPRAARVRLTRIA